MQIKNFEVVLNDLINAEKQGVDELIKVAETLPRSQNPGWQIGLLGIVTKLRLGLVGIHKFHIAAVYTAATLSKPNRIGFGAGSVEVLFCLFMAAVSRQEIGNKNITRLWTAWQAVGGFIFI
jgi:hypothetical protein